MGSLTQGLGLGLSGAGSAATMYGANVAAQGQVLSGEAAAQSATFNAEIATTNAQILSQNATWAGQAGEANAGIAEQQTREQVGALKANQAAKGVDVNSGSAVDVRESAAATGMLNALQIRSNAAKIAYGAETAAASETATAALDTSQAGYAIKGANISSQATVLGAAGQNTSAFGNYLLQNSTFPSNSGAPGSSGNPITWDQPSVATDAGSGFGTGTGPGTGGLY